MTHFAMSSLALVFASIVSAADQPRVSLAKSDPLQKDIINLHNSGGLSWQLSKGDNGWALGVLALNGKPIEASGTKGLMSLRNRKTGALRWLAGGDAKQVDTRTAKMTGNVDVDGVTFTYSVYVALDETLAVVRWTTSWSVDKDLNDWEVCLAYHDGFANDWRVQSYPWAGNSEKVAISPMRYCGVPGVLVYRPDQSLVVLFAIDSNSDYLNPTTWTGKTDFHFANRSIAPQFRMGGGKLAAGIKYEMPLQLFLSDAGEFAGAITEIMQTWIKLNNYKVDDSLKVRTPQEAFDLALEGRRNMESWKPGVGYEHHKGTPFVYVGNNPFIAYYEYRQYEITGDKLWRDRAFEQIDFALKGQQSSGVFHTSWYFKQATPEFCSRDWSHDGYKVDINVWMSRYILQTWQRVKEKEGIDRQDWYKAAIASLEWIKSQQNQDGGLPQCVDIKTGKKSFSVVCGRALVGLPLIARITGDESYLKLCTDMEKFLRSGVEGRFWYTGMHPDLPPGDFEQDSIYAVVEYWLDKHDRTGDKESLDRAVANAYYGLLYWCPKQLNWVNNPTQGAHSEQQAFNQYSVYSYGNRKIQCLDRLFKKTANPLFEQLKNRVMQLNFYVQVADGPYKGAMTEAISDPWLERKQGFEWRGNPYTSEMVSDLMLQLIEMGYVKSDALQKETSGGWKKFEGNPVMGGKYGTCFDISVLKEGDTYRMWLSWRPKKSIALVESKDGIHWSEPPKAVFGPRLETGWENDINRPYVLKRADGYHMWYTGQAKGRSWIGYATSSDGVTWKRMSDKPVLSPDQPWEKNIAVMCPSVLWDETAKQFRMWYSGGEQNEPNAIGYATSPNGLTWKKNESNPVFIADPNNPWEKHKVTACQVEKVGEWYVMFYIGFENEGTARICLARSKDGITNWQRHPTNPIIFPGKGKWDHNACYKPYAIFDGQKWLLWYNGRRGGLEQIGVVLHDGEELGF